MVAAMPAAGVTAMILNNANLLARDADRWKIRLDDGHASLLNDKRRQEIAALASDLEGRAVQVEFELGKPAEETPAQRKSRLRAQGQAEAMAIALRDDNVRALLAEFGGKLESVRPREPLAQGQVS